MGERAWSPVLSGVGFLVETGSQPPLFFGQLLYHGVLYHGVE